MDEGVLRMRRERKFLGPDNLLFVLKPVGFHTVTFLATGSQPSINTKYKLVSGSPLVSDRRAICPHGHHVPTLVFLLTRAVILFISIHYHPLFFLTLTFL